MHCRIIPSSLSLASADTKGIHAELNSVVTLGRWLELEAINQSVMETFTLFNDIEFYKINREERHFGFLLFSSLLYDLDFRAKFLGLLSEKLQENLSLNDDFVDLFAEVSLLRDYWYNLGDHKKYNDVLHTRRIAVVEQLLEHFEIDTNIIKQYDLFWTGAIGSSKLWYPGKWDIAKMKLVQLEEDIKENRLLRIRWSFNAKPDFLLVMRSSAVFIELKVESGIGDNTEGYNQDQTQVDIIDFARTLTPYLKNKKLYKVKITQNELNTIRWGDFIQLVSNKDVARHLQNIPQPKGANRGIE